MIRKVIIVILTLAAVGAGYTWSALTDIRREVSANTLVVGYEGFPYASVSVGKGALLPHMESVHGGAHLIMPIWLLFALVATFPGICVARFVFDRSRRHRRRRRGQCLYCGYDLTGNVSGVCPECGTKIDRL